MLPLRRFIAILALLPLLLATSTAIAADAGKLRAEIKQNSTDTSLLLERQEALAEQLDQLADDMAAAASSDATAAEEARLQLEIAEVEFKQNPNPQTKRARDAAAQNFKKLSANNQGKLVDVSMLREKHTAIRNELEFINEELSRLSAEMSTHRKALEELSNAQGTNKLAGRSSGGGSAASKSTTKSAKSGTPREPRRPDLPAVPLDENFDLLLSSRDIGQERARIKPSADERRVLRRKGLSIETWNGDLRDDSNYMMQERAQNQYFVVIKLKQGLNILRSGSARWIMQVPAEDDGASYVFTMDASDSDKPMLRTWAGRR